mmetsp:Transcript_12498/g.28981  ORF Transcript_12498/g.28981 Transcript_12498/m.28981 type:complete len:329 (+) Transcript_12498:2088-3074(+)
MFSGWTKHSGEEGATFSCMTESQMRCSPLGDVVVRRSASSPVKDAAPRTSPSWASQTDPRPIAGVVYQVNSSLAEEGSAFLASPMPLAHETTGNVGKDEQSVVSSLSNEDICREDMCQAFIVETKTELPKEVSVPRKHSMLAETPSPEALCKPTMSTQDSSSAVPCPSWHKYSHMDSRAMSLDSLVLGGRVVEGVASKHKDLDGGDLCPLLVGRKRRHVDHIRHGSGTTITVGSMVGQSSMSTAPTMSSELSYSPKMVRKHLQQGKEVEKRLNWVSGVDESIGCCAAASQRNVVRDEVHYLLGRISSPIRNLRKKPCVELKRASGRLV